MSEDTTYPALAERYDRTAAAWEMKAAEKRLELAHIADESLRESHIVVSLREDYERLVDVRAQLIRVSKEFQERDLLAKELTAQAHITAATQGRLQASHGYGELPAADDETSREPRP
jgi:hypothetical protein